MALVNALPKTRVMTVSALKHQILQTCWFPQQRLPGCSRPEGARRGAAGTPRDRGAPPAGRSVGSATPSRKSTSKTPSEQIRSGSAVKRKFAPCGQLAGSPGSVRQRASAAHTASGLHVRYY